MKILLFGATGMVGAGVLRECLAARDVEQVTAIGRTPTGVTHDKLRDLVHADLFDTAAIASQLAGFDACFFCLGVSSGGTGEREYTRLTLDLTLAAARVLARLNPSMTFIYVSGAGTDSSERGRVMWARVKGKTENALLELPFRAVMFRPGLIQPLDGIRSKTPAYRWFYVAMVPLFPLMRWLAPSQLLTTRDMGRAMLKVARGSGEKPILESRDIRALLD
jgi:uncharacterized protein YbjT (DUF2867 family)